MLQRTGLILLACLALSLFFFSGPVAGPTSPPPGAIPPAAAPAAPAAVPQAAASAPAPDAHSVVVTEEMRDHQRWEDTLYFAGTAYGFIILIALLGLGISGRLRDIAVRLSRRPFLAAMACFVLFIGISTLLSFPLDYFTRFVIPHRFALSDQGFGGWLWDYLKTMLVGMVLGAPLVALALRGVARIRQWWLALWLGSVPVVLFLVLIGPVILAPVFNDFQPLKDQKLKKEILDLAAKAGISGGRVYQVDKSKQTKEMNAYVNGLGPTQRIVLWDTIIAKMSHDELKFVMAHEMAHYLLNHIWKLLVTLLALLLVAFWGGQRVVEWATRKWGRSWGFEAPHDPAAVPLLFLTFSLFVFLLTPVMYGVSRYFEHESDTFALEVTRLNDAGARSFVKFAEDSKVLPDPPAFIRFWRYAHPTLAERIEFCRTYKPWEQGKPNQLWKGN